MIKLTNGTSVYFIAAAHIVSVIPNAYNDGRPTNKTRISTVDGKEFYVDDDAVSIVERVRGWLS